MSKELLPCPFCGCKDVQFWEADNEMNRFQIVCMQCFNGTDICVSEKVTIEKWNTRKPIDRIVEQLTERQYEESGYCRYPNKACLNQIYANGKIYCDSVPSECEPDDEV